MKKTIASFLAVLLPLSPVAYAGVVMDLVTTNSSGKEVDRSRVYAQSGKIRMEQVDRGAATMIFLGNEFMYIDHDEKSYVVIDEAMIDQVSAQIDAAMKEMEAQLADMPPDQRAMVEQMMKSRMGGMAGQQAPPSPPMTVESKGPGEWGSYKCRKYEIFEASRKTQDICAADLDEIEGADEIMESFRRMAAYMEKLLESMPMRSEQPMNPGELMDQIDGFPVHTIDYVNGSAVRQTSLDSATEQSLDEGLFMAPQGYRRQDPFGQGRR